MCTNAVFAQGLCDASCNLTITFPDGGSITAVEPLTFTFGDGGLVDTVSTTTAYVNGNTLVLGGGEVITFSTGGSFDLGTSGNIDYTNMTIATTGDITIETVGGTATITILDMNITDGPLVLNGGDVSIENNLTLSGDLTITGTGTGTLELISGTTNLEADLDISNGSIISTSGSLTVSNSVIDIGEINITSLTEITVDGVLYTSDDNLVFKDPDGATGSLELVDDGFVFVPDVVEQSADSSGVSGLLLALGLPVIVSVFRRRQVTDFSIRSKMGSDSN